ncbi:MAG: FHA domain-containing protein [Ruminococcus sp.]|nr:FHA domain-containing protein [Ruminococcus sp.]
MGIFNFKEIYSKTETYLVYSFGKKRQMNLTQIQSFNDNQFYDFFVPFKCTKTGKGGKINFNISGLTSLSEFLKVDIKQEQYFSIISDIQRITSFCQKHFFQLENLIFNPKYMYYHNITGKVMMAYVPLRNDDNKFINGSAVKCLLDIHKKSRISITDGSFINEYENYLDKLKKDEQNFTPDALYRLLSEMRYVKKKKSDSIIKNETDSERYEIEKQIINEPLKDTDIPEKSHEKPVIPEEDSSATVIRIRTSLPGSPFLMDMTGKKIEITKNPFRIGRGKDNDFVLSDSMISSHHAQIIHDSGEYYIVDNNSSNGTYLNDIDNKILRARIVDGNSIFFAMNRYIFKTSKTQIDVQDSDYINFDLLNEDDDRTLAYIKKVSDDNVITIRHYPFSSKELSDIIFFEKKHAGETLLYMENTSCNSLRLENIDVPIGEKVEIFSGCTLSVNGELYTFTVEN